MCTCHAVISPAWAPGKDTINTVLFFDDEDQISALLKGEVVSVIWHPP